MDRLKQNNDKVMTNWEKRLHRVQQTQSDYLDISRTFTYQLEKGKWN